MSDFIDYTHTPHLKNHLGGRICLLLDYLANGKSLGETCKLLGWDEEIAKSAILEISKTWDNYFPGDWIAPGEYRTCSQGVHWLPLRQSTCLACTGDIEERKVGQKASNMLEKQRYVLAERRRLSGVKKLFWLSKEDKEKIEVVEEQAAVPEKKPTNWLRWLFTGIG